MTTPNLVLGTETDFASRTGALPAVLDAYERALILVALAAANGHQRQAARLLGIGATTLNQKMKRLSLRGLALARPTSLSEPGEPRQATSEEYRWRGRLPSGHRVEIRAVNGDIRVEPAVGDEVEVVALKPVLTGAPHSFRLEITVVQSEDSLTIAARYSPASPLDAADSPTAPSPPRLTACPPPDELRVNFRVRVPRESRVDARTLNGDIDLHGLSGVIRAESFSGSVSVSPDHSR